ncbi:hypothetical protein TR51_18755 [Kitasatospora griseola]|uniref:Uncharacterized protein n=1 Tax=Kitasatospora griseola TaxID=2064 RepID=A0A0D0P2G1_KITGR|nr:hypothetical protein TR51_18755 [Kitasatospora griseola]
MEAAAECGEGGVVGGRVEVAGGVVEDQLAGVSALGAGEASALVFAVGRRGVGWAGCGEWVGSVG